jgi:FkbM family methyltransferase
MKQPDIISLTDCGRILDEVRSKSQDYQSLWQDRPAGQSLVDLMTDIRSRVDPERPYFFGELSSGIKFAGDARDLPAVLHSIYPGCNGTLIAALIEELGEQEGDVFDIGANIGIVTASLARHMGTLGRVHAFEPSPETFKIAAATLALNGLQNVVLTEAAVGDEDGEIRFHATPGNSAVASAKRHDFGFLAEWVEIAVASRRVDTFVSERGCKNIPLIKIDVEGHEMNVLRGATSTIERFRPTVVYEYTPLTAADQGWVEADSISLVGANTPYRFDALIEPHLDGMGSRGRVVSFPLPEGLGDQVNVFARPINTGNA